MVVICEDAQREEHFTRRQKATTFQSNSSVVSKLIRPKLDLNLGNGYIEKRSPDGQYSAGVSPNDPVQNRSASENDDTAKTYVSMFQ
jgi:hypothetical protein